MKSTDPAANEDSTWRRWCLPALACVLIGVCLSVGAAPLAYRDGAPPQTDTALIVLIAGTLLSLLLGAQLRAQARRRLPIEQRMKASTAALLEANVELRRHAEAREATLHELRESEARYRLLADNATDLLSCHDEHGAITYVSPAAHHLLGYEPEELIGRNAYELFPSEDIGTIRREVATLLRTREAFTRNYRLRRRDGHAVWVETMHRILPGSADSMVLCVSRDVTSRMQAERALRDSELMFRTVFEHSAVGMGLFSTGSGRFFRANHALGEMLGYSVAEFEGTTIRDITHPADQDVTPSEIQRVLSGDRESFVVEKRYLHKNGSTVWILANTTLIRHADGEPRHFVTQIQDISDRKQAESRLAQLSHRQDLILNAAGEGICGVDSDGRIGFANRVAAEILGFTPEEIIGRPLYATGRRDDTHDPEWAMCRVFRTIRDRQTLHANDETFRHRDGRAIAVHYVASPMLEQGRATGAVVVFSPHEEAGRLGHPRRH